MIIISNVTYPPESAKEIAKRFLTAPALPGFWKKKDLIFLQIGKKGSIQ